MFSLIKLLLEQYGGKIFELPSSHKAGMHSEKGFSCSVCEYFHKEGNTCGNKYFQKWKGDNKIPGDPAKYCSDWFEEAK